MKCEYIIGLYWIVLYCKRTCYGTQPVILFCIYFFLYRSPFGFYLEQNTKILKYLWTANQWTQCAPSRFVQHKVVELQNQLILWTIRDAPLEKWRGGGGGRPNAGGNSARQWIWKKNPACGKWKKNIHAEQKTFLHTKWFTFLVVRP